MSRHPGKLPAWIFGLLTGIVAGIGIAVSVLHFEPSDEYREAMEGLRVVHEARADTLETIREAIRVADDSVAALLEEAAQDDRDIATARASADAHRRRADSLHAANEGSDDPEALRMEIDTLRAALDDRERECLLCEDAILQRDVTIATLQSDIMLRDDEIRVLEADNADLEDALDVARSEISRRAVVRVPRWFHPHVTVGVGCTIKLQCGPAVTVGFSFSPF